jgi:hypothetical protein
MAAAPGGPAYTAGKPHRGTMVLILGIVSIICNLLFIPGVLAWVFGNSDLKEMDAGSMDPSGRGLTQAGKVLGIIGTVITIAGAVVAILRAVTHH